MKNIFRRLYIFFLNCITLLRALGGTEKLDFSLNKIFLKRNVIDKSVKLYPPYNITDSTIGHSSYVNLNSRISFTSIGKFCSIGPNFLCGWGIHPTTGISTSPIFYSRDIQVNYTLSSINKIEERKKITIGNDVFIGANVFILDGVSIGDGAIIGAGAVVSKNIPAYAIAVGCPIKIVKYRYPPEIIQQLLQIKWWDKDADFLKKVESNFFDIKDFLGSIAKD